METTTIPSYFHDLKGRRENLKNMLPPPALTAFDGYAEELNKQFKNILKVKAGDQAPEFTLANAIGNPISLRNMLKKGKVVLVFYRGSGVRIAICNYTNYKMC